MMSLLYLSCIQLKEGKKHAEVHICVLRDALNPIPMQRKVAVETHLIIFSMIGWREVNLDTMTSRSSSLLSSGTGTIYEVIVIIHRYRPLPYYYNILD